MQLLRGTLVKAYALLAIVEWHQGSFLRRISTTTNAHRIRTRAQKSIDDHTRQLLYPYDYAKSTVLGFHFYMNRHLPV